MLEDADKNIQVNKNLVKILIEHQEALAKDVPKLDKKLGKEDYN